MLNKITDTIEVIKAGKIIILVDDGGMDNSGFLMLPSEFATDANLAFILKNTGKLSTVIHEKDEKVVEVTGLPQKFTNSIKRSVSGGVLKKSDIQEAATDLLNIAGLDGTAVLGMLIKDDGSAAKMPDIEVFADENGLKIASIEDLIAYRRETECYVIREAEANLPTAFGTFKMVGFVNQLNGEHHVALVKGEISEGDEVLVRVHSECLTGDAFHSLKCDCGEQLDAALGAIEKEGKGILLYLRQEGRGIGLINKIKAYKLQEEGMDTEEANIALGFPPDLRDYGIGAQILSDLKAKKIRLLTNNPKKVVGLKGYGIEIVDRVPLVMDTNLHNERYFQTKKEKMGHLY